MHNNCQAAATSPKSPEFQRHQRRAKTIFDGTKLPLVEHPPQYHNPRYESQRVALNLRFPFPLGKGLGCPP
jgi:hypothetical protein